MPREIDGTVKTELVSQQLTPIGLVELMFDSGPFRMWTGIGELVWGAEGAWSDGTLWGDDTAWTDTGGPTTWYGAGNLGTISQIEETTELRAVGIELHLSGIPAEVLEIAIRENFQNRPARIYYGVLDDQGQLIGEPFQLFAGIMDQMQLTEGDQASIVLTCESDEIDFERTMARRYTAEDQRSAHPGDAAYDMVTSLQEIEIVWAVN